MDIAPARPERNPFADASQQFIFYPSSVHHQVVTRIVRGLESHCGLLLLTGEIGIGKTTLARHIRQNFARDFTFVELGNPYLSPAEQIYHFCQGFGVPLEPGSGAKDRVDALQRHLLALHQAGENPVIIIDESHLLTREHFGQFLVMSNLRYENAPLVQILLVGQLEIMDRLAEPGLEALNQRIGVRCELRPLTLGEAREYIRFKLKHAGDFPRDLFTARAVERIWKVSGGLPRLINHICAHAYDQLAFSGRDRVDPGMVAEVSRDAMYRELFTTRTRKPRDRRGRLAAAVLLSALALAGLSALLWPRAASRPDAPAGEARTAPAPAAPPAPAPAAPAPPAAQTAPAPPPAPPAAAATAAAEPTPPAPTPAASALNSLVVSTPEPASPLADATPAPTPAAPATALPREPAATTPAPAEQPLAAADPGPTAATTAPPAPAPVEPAAALAEPAASGAAGEPAAPARPGENAAADPGASPPAGESGGASGGAGKEKAGPARASQDRSDGAMTPDVQEGDAASVPDGADHPVVGRISIDAVVWGGQPSERIVVLNEKIMREGDHLGTVRLDHIGLEYLFFSYQGKQYKRRWQR